MIILKKIKRCFAPRWLISLITFLILGLFLTLGYWQLQRAQQKKDMLDAQQRQASQPALAWTPGMKLPKQYQPLSIKGHYLPQTYLLDNQHHQHEFGYDVFSPLLLNNQKVILVDRGWIAGDLTRQHLPVFSTPQHAQHVSGMSYYPSPKIWLLGDNIDQKNNKIAVIERIDTQAISQLLHKSVYPFIIRLDKKNGNGYIRDWQIVSMPPERHYGYALQWFAMALVIMILYVILNLKKVDETDEIKN